MIEIKNERGQVLALYPDTTIEQELNSWVLADDALPGSFSLPFKFSLAVPENQAFLGHKHRMEATNITGIAVNISLEGLPRGVATLQFRVKDDVADAFLVFDGGTIAPLLRNKTLPEIFAFDSFILADAPDKVPGAMALTLGDTNPFPFVFFPVYAPDFTPENKSKDNPYFEYNPIINDYSRNAFVGDLRPKYNAETKQTTDTFGSPVVPFFYLHWVIEKVCTYLGYVPDGEWFFDQDVRKLVLFNQVAISVNSFLGFGVQVLPKFHVWNMKLNEFFKFLRSDLGVGVFFDNQTGRAIFRTFVEIATEPPTLDLGTQLLKGSSSDPIRQGGYSIQFPEMGPNKEYTVAPYEIGNAENSVSLKLSTLAMTLKSRKINAFLSSQYLIPQCAGRGQSLDIRYAALEIFSFDLTKTETEPILLSFYGLQRDRISFKYPFASGISRNMRQEKTGKLSVHPDESDSIFHRWVRPFYEFKTFSKPVTQKLRLKIGQSCSLRLWETVLANTPQGVALPCLIEKITTQWPAEDGFLRAEAKMWPLIVPSDYTPRIPTGVFIRIFLKPIFGFFETPGVVASSIIFQFFSDAQGLVPAQANRITIHYQYAIAGYDASEERITYQTEQRAVKVETPQLEIIANLFWAAWSAQTQESFYKTLPNSKWALLSSLQILPGAGYRIIN